MVYDSTPNSPSGYLRDLAGYGRTPPHAQWPGGARIAVQFVLNYEEGGENSVLHGDAGSEQFLSEMFNPPAFADRHISMEGIYEYGARAGVWRILREFEKRKLPLTVFGVSTALKRSPDVAAAFIQLGHEIACHGYKWISYQNIDEATERAHMQLAMDIIANLSISTSENSQKNHLTANQVNDRSLHGAGWYTGRDSPNTRRLVADFGGFAYDSDYYGDDLPFWMKVRKTDGQDTHQLIVPYTLDCNDMRFALPQGYSHGDPFFQYMRDTFDALYAEGDPNGLNAPKMMSIGMHCRILGRPGRIVALQRFLDHIEKHSHVWVAQRVQIAQHWRTTHPCKEAA
jgi:allantoinase